MDVTGNDHLEPLDALRVINYINKFGSGPIPTDQSEGEAASTVPPTIAEGEPLVAHAVASIDVNPSRWTQEPRIGNRAATLRDRAEPTLQRSHPSPDPAPMSPDTSDEPVFSRRIATVETTFGQDEILGGEMVTTLTVHWRSSSNMTMMVSTADTPESSWSQIREPGQPLGQQA